MMGQHRWNKENIPDLGDKIIIVTGGNSGIGFQSAKMLAFKGAEVIIACRSVEKGEKATQRIQRISKKAKIRVMKLDLADLKSIRSFTDEFKKRYSRLDVLINNAGIMNVPYSHTKDGFEMQLGTNHLGHFALTALLMESLEASPGSRVINVSSIAHKKAQINFENLMFDGGANYKGMVAYRLSKLANLYFTFGLQSLFDSKKSKSIAVAAHPGITESNIARHLLGPIFFPILKPLIKIVLQNASVGALPQIRAAVDPMVRGGQFYGPKGLNEWKGYPVLVEPTQLAKNAENARRLWDISGELTGVTFD